ncbi:hypothetical protein [Alcanivorax sp. IL2]|uniref:hypothetical protein n=1 Tax=Alcanivorax sp. IL2 TaxID=3396310 RepID=UPI0039C1584E
MKESALEATLVANPDLLCLDDAGIFYRNVHIVRQASARAITGTQKYPDIMFLTDTGDVGVVEVKRFGNPELQDRKVISQIIDYGATVTTLDEDKQVRMLRGPNSSAETLDQLVREVFPKSEYLSSLTAKIRRQLQYGQLHYIIACDRAPEGLATWVASVSQSSTTDFSIRVLEVCPYQQDDAPASLIWFSAPIIKTETIQRTTIRIESPGSQHGLAVNVESEISEEGKVLLGMSGRGNRQSNMAVATANLAEVAKSLPYPSADLFAFLDTIHKKALDKDWEWLVGGLETGDTTEQCYLRGTNRPGFVEGRYGVNWLKPARPSFFAGYYFNGWDHGVEPVGEAGSFAVILDVDRAWGRKKRFYESAEFHELVNRMTTVKDWEVERGPNDWHPIILRRCMKTAFSAVNNENEFENKWFEMAEEGIGLLMEGGELAAFKSRVGVVE